MLPADMVGGVSASRAANLEVQGELLKDFQRRIETVLSNFEGSAGNPAKVGSQTISRASLSSGHGQFDEAQALYQEYNRVHTHLTSLSRTLKLQIEAIGIAVLGAKNGFDSLEEDLRYRFWQIQTQIKQEQQTQHRTNHAKDGGSL